MPVVAVAGSEIQAEVPPGGWGPFRESPAPRFFQLFENTKKKANGRAQWAPGAGADRTRDLRNYSFADLGT